MVRRAVGPEAIVARRVVVVGAGPAGCVVARRLGDAGHEVTLVEAGPGEPRPQSVQGLDWFQAIAEPGWTWPGLMVSRVKGQELQPYLRGRGLGGCSAINGMVALAGPVEDVSLFANPRSQSQVSDDVYTEQAELGPVALALSGHLDVAPAQLMVRDGARLSAYDLYLGPDAASHNVTVRTNAEVETLDVTSGRRVVGVSLVSGEQLDAEHVVVCAGAIHSPTLLLRSGVLNAHVGKGLQDHPAVAFTLQLREQTPADGERPGAVGGLVSWSSGMTNAEHDLQLTILEHLGEQSGYAQIALALMKVESRGKVSIDEDGNPVVEFDLLSSRIDRVRLRTGVRKLVELLSSDALRSALGSVVSAVFVGDQGAGLDTVPVSASDDVLDTWLMQHLSTYVHATGSCQLDAAVGRAGEVRGWQGVSVIDASVMPQIPRTNTQIPTQMLAESLVGELQMLLNR